MKKIGIALLAIVMILTFSACSRNTVQNPDPQKSPNVIVDPEPKGEDMDVTLYYMNTEYIATGNESLEKGIVRVKQVTVGEKPLEEVILAELQKKPEDSQLSTALENIKILSVETAEDTAYVNLSGDKLSGGSLEEGSILYQIVYSLTELPDIHKVQILVDGSKRETLMGHMFIEEPLTRKDVSF